MTRPMVWLDQMTRKHYAQRSHPRRWGWLANVVFTWLAITNGLRLALPRKRPVPLPGRLLGDAGLLLVVLVWIYWFVRRNEGEDFDRYRTAWWINIICAVVTGVLCLYSILTGYVA